MSPVPSPTVSPRGGFAHLTRQSAIFSLGALAGKLIALIMVPILTRAMSRGDFGRYDILSALTSALISALLLGLDTASARLYFDQPDPATKARLMATWLAMAVILSSVPAAALVVFASPISDALLGSAEYSTAIALVGANTLAGTLHFYALTVLRVRQRAVAFAAVAGLSLLVTAGATLALLALTDNELVAVMNGLLAGSVVGAVTGLALCKGETRGRPSFAMARLLAVSGLPLAAGTVVVWFGDFFNRAALLRLAGAEAAALFSVAFRFGTVGVLVVTGFQLAWQPRVFERGSNAEAIARLQAEGRRIVATVSLLTAMIALLAPELLRLIGGTPYAPALPAVGWSLGLAIASALFQVASMPLALDRDFRSLGLGQGAAAATAAAGTLLLARHHGASGVMFSLVLGQMIGYVIVAARARRRCTTGIRFGRTGTLALVVGVVAVGLCALDLTGVVPRSLAGLAVVIVAAHEGTLRDAGAWLGRQHSRARNGPDASTRA